MPLSHEEAGSQSRQGFSHSFRRIEWKHKPSQTPIDSSWAQTHVQIGVKPVRSNSRGQLQFVLQAERMTIVLVLH